MNTNIEKKYRKRVNENGWMVKFQQLCWGNSTPNFTGFCPFFWFTWLSLLLSPVVVPVRMIAKLFIAVIDTLVDARRAVVRRPKDSLLLSFYLNLRDTPEYQAGDVAAAIAWELEENAEFFHKVLRWIKVTPDWENCAQQVLLRHQAREERKAAGAVKSDARAKKLRWVANYAAYVLKPLLAVVALTISFFVVKFMIAIAERISLHALKNAAEVLGAALALAVLVLAIISGVSKLTAWWRKCPTCPGRWDWTYNWVFYLTAPIAEGVEFLAETVSVIYTRECPLIEWDDESGPIERRYPQNNP